MKILLISTCAEKLHKLEFVKPIEKILKENKINFFTKHYSKLNIRGDLANADKIIICGTSLKDNEFINHLSLFSWISSSSKPILGICAGMQIISLVYELDRQVKELDIRNNLNHVSKKKTEIGFFKENFKKEFLSLKGRHEVYHLHNNYISLPKDFEKFTTSKIPQAIKHKSKEIYGVLFHPEVRNKVLIEEFLKL